MRSSRFYLSCLLVVVSDLVAGVLKDLNLAMMVMSEPDPCDQVICLVMSGDQ